MGEVDIEKFNASFRFCVYLHKRPDHSVFYVGKGLKERATDFSPSRRTDWHKNIVKKHGRENIVVEIIPCVSEFEAFKLERSHISAALFLGAKLANLTSGGEGAAGRTPTKKQLDGLAKGRLAGKKAHKGPRPKLTEWVNSAAGIAHSKLMGEAGAKRLHQKRDVVCCECNCKFSTFSAKAKACSRLCEQRYRRAGKNIP